METSKRETAAKSWNEKVMDGSGYYARRISAPADPLPIRMAKIHSEQNKNKLIMYTRTPFKGGFIQGSLYIELNKSHSRMKIAA